MESLLVSLIVLLILAVVAYFLIVTFVPVGTFRTAALIIVGLLLLLYFVLKIMPALP